MDSSPLTSAILADLRTWFRAKSVAYPWTQTEDPYAIWISEIMLQQTVVSAVVERFRQWMTRWPDLAALAQAPREEVLRAWEGLGYATRAQNLHRAAQQLVASGKLTLPSDEVALRGLPGVGDYTASAILSFAFHQPALTLDANLKRVFQRLDAEPVWTSVVEDRWRATWRNLVDGPSSRECNQSVMQLGQLVCRPSNPDCPRCPLRTVCRAAELGVAASIPQKQPRLVTEKTTTVVFWHRDQGSLWWLAQPKKGRFFPLWLVAPHEGSLPTSPTRNLKPRVHTYTRYRDHLVPLVAGWAQPENPPLPQDWQGRWVTVEEARALGMVSVYRRLFDEAVAGPI